MKNMKNISTLNKMKGLTIIELMIGMAIFVIFVVTIARSIPVAQEQSRITGIVQMVSDGQRAATAYASGGGIYTGISVAALVARNLLPVQITDGVAENAFGGDFIISSPSQTQMLMTFTGIPEEAGADLLAKYQDFSPTYTAGTSTFTVTFNG
jgi:hypothetical protein